MSQNLPDPKESKPGDEPPRPQLSKLVDLLQGPLNLQSVALTVLACLALFYTLYFARGIVLPITLAVLLSFLLAPLVRGLNRIGLPESLGAALVVVTFLAGTSYGIYRLSGPATEWMRKAPRSIQQLEIKLRSVKEPVEQMNKAAEEVEKMTEMGDGRKRQEVKITQPSLSETVLTQTPSFLVETAATLVLLYFLLASGDLFLGKVVRILPGLQDKKHAVEISRKIEGQISTYLLTITLINASLGVTVGIAMALWGMPNPALWGALAGLLNFVPYLGAIVNLILLSLVAVVTFDQTWQIFLVLVTYLGLTTLEAYLLTPLILGRRLTLNPVVIFVSLIFWGWLWGIAGALLAVPVLVALKIFCDHIEPLSAIGEFLGW